MSYFIETKPGKNQITISVIHPSFYLQTLIFDEEIIFLNCESFSGGTRILEGFFAEISNDEINKAKIIKKDLRYQIFLRVKLNNF